MVDEEALLDDLLCGGVYGGASMSRQHSSNITLNRVAAEKQGKKISNSLLQTIFPSLDAMKGRFLYLEKYPWLLPVAWIIRIWKYRKESSQMEDNSAGESIRIGNQRVELMKKYGIIKED